jgi:tetratricopeptide (TPR) repeat protein
MNFETTFNIRQNFVIGLFLIFATLFVYGPVRNYEFVNFDDPKYIYKNPHIQAGLTSESIIWSFTTTYAANWHPLTWLSHMVDVELFGMNPSGHHISNIIFHLANTLLLFFILWKMTGKPWRSGLVAGLFALHPLHVESVAWVSERKDVLSTFFFMLTIWEYIYYVNQPNIRRYIIVCIFFALGLMAKPMLVTLPFVLLLLDYWPLNRLKFKGHRLSTPKIPSSILVEKIPLFILSVASSIVTFMAQKSAGAVGSLDLLPLNARISNALVSYILYIGKMAWPFSLAVFYPHPQVFPTWQIAGSCLLLTSISLLVIWQMKKRFYLFVGWWWYVVTLIPAIGLVQVGRQAMADRYTYIPLIGLFIIITWGANDILAWLFRADHQNKFKHLRSFKTISTILILITLLSLSAISRKQVKYWTNSTALYEHALRITSNNYIVHYNLGNVLLSQDKFDKAIDHYKKALHNDPGSSETNNNLGLALAKKKKINAAIKHYFQALRIDPTWHEPHNNLGNVFASQGYLDQAIEHYLEALQLDPEFADAHNNLGLALMRKGNIIEAIAHFRKAQKIKPDDASATRNLNRAVSIKGKIDKAVANMYEAMQINPDDTNLHNKLDKLNMRKKELDEVIFFYQKALKPQPGYTEDALDIDNYAKVYRVKKDFYETLSRFTESKWKEGLDE